jgi:hypothetical protein
LIDAASLRGHYEHPDEPPALLHCPNCAVPLKYERTVFGKSRPRAKRSPDERTNSHRTSVAVLASRTLTDETTGAPPRACADQGKGVK